MKWSVQKFLRKSHASFLAADWLTLVRVPWWTGVCLAGGLALAGCQRQVKSTATINPVTTSAPLNSPITALSHATALTTLIPTAKLFEYTRFAPNRVSLTFDAGSDNSAVRPILAALEQHHNRATFFLTGKFCEQYPDSCRAIADAGMEIGNHSYSHPSFIKRTDVVIATQLDRAELAIIKACGRGAKPLFRFPYGDCSPRTRHAVVDKGYQPIGWTLDSLDSVGKPKSADFVAKRIIAKIKPGYITLMHVSYRHSAEALPRIFAYLGKQGLKSVPVSELYFAAHPPTSMPTPAQPIFKKGYSKSALNAPLKERL